LRVFINSIRFNRSLVDGPGVRTVIFFQGCDIHCKGCQNPSSWDISKGKPYETDELVKLLREKVINKKITLSGGEPLMQKDAVSEIVKKLPDFDIALYTGHELNEVPAKCELRKDRSFCRKVKVVCHAFRRLYKSNIYEGESCKNVTKMPQTDTVTLARYITSEKKRLKTAY